MIIFKELILENFGPYKGKNIINLAPDLDNNISIILFGGINGGGKTTLMDGIRLALYGRRAECSTRGNLSYNDFLLQCINKNISLGTKTRVELTLEYVIDHKWTELKVVRYWDHTVKDGKDNLGVIEGQFPDINLTQNWDEYIEKFLPLGISNLFLFDGEQVKELAEEDLPSPKVVEAIKSLLGLELADKLIIDLDFLVNRKQKDFVCDEDIKNFEYFQSKLLVLEAEKKILLQELSLIEKEVVKAKKRYYQVSKNLRDEGLKIATEKESLRLEKNFLLSKINLLESDLLKLVSGFLPLYLIFDLLCDVQGQLQLEEELLQLKTAENILIDRDYKLLDFLISMNIDDRHLIKIQQFLESEHQIIKEKTISSETYLNANQKTKLKLDLLINKILEEDKLKVIKKEKELEVLKEKIEEIELRILEIQVSEKYQSLEKEVKKEEKKCLILNSNLDKLKNKNKTIIEEIETIRNKLKTYSDGNIKNQKGQQIRETLPKIKETLNKFQEKLTLKKLNKLEVEVTQCFRYLLHKSNLINRVSIATETYALTLYNYQGEIIPKRRLSAGEKQLLAISLLWGLARVSEKHLPMAIDTPLARLDSSHRHHLIERYFPCASHQVILLSTDTEITQQEITKLREKETIVREYLLNYDKESNITTIQPGYFW